MVRKKRMRHDVEQSSCSKARSFGEEEEEEEEEEDNGPGGGGPNPFAPVEPVTFEEVSRNAMLNEEKRKTCKEGCWGCLNPYNEESPVWMVYKRFRLECTPEILFDKVANAHYKYVYLPLLLHKKEAVLWTKKDVRTHVLFVMSDSTFRTGLYASRLGIISSGMEDSLFMTLNGDMKSNDKAIKTYLNLVSMHMNILEKFDSLKN